MLLILEAFGGSGRGLGEVWGRSRGGFPRVLVAFGRFWVVFGGSDWVWNGFMKFSQGSGCFAQPHIKGANPGGTPGDSNAGCLTPPN